MRIAHNLKHSRPPQVKPHLIAKIFIHGTPLCLLLFAQTNVLAGPVAHSAECESRPNPIEVQPTRHRSAGGVAIYSLNCNWTRMAEMNFASDYFSPEISPCCIC